MRGLRRFSTQSFDDDPFRHGPRRRAIHVFVLFLLNVMDSLPKPGMTNDTKAR